MQKIHPNLRRWLLGFVSPVVMIGAIGLPAQAETVAPSFFQGSTPLSLTLQELDDRWRVFSVTGQIETSNMLSLTAAVFGASPSDYYTKGEIAEVGGERFLVAYRVMPGSITEPTAVNGSTPIHVSLIHLDQVASLNDFRPFSLVTEIDRLKALIQSRAASPFNMFNSGGPPRSLPPLPRSTP
ncbi:hypothetical protein [Limnothrix redekei]|uniref:Uncharacterized protein n=1 Tax=Limnothrix redekei LRLZ20PSL1 TaxID=3112953 RepID=A0ABW7C7R4_9CYAN